MTFYSPLNTSVNDFSDDLRLSLDDTVHTDTHDFVPECVADFWVRDLDQHELRDVADFLPTNEISTIDVFVDGEVMLEVTKLEDKRMIFDAENMLITTFSNFIPCPAGDKRPSLKDLAEVTYAKTNYQIKKITKVYNPRIECMHNCFRTCYDIQDEKQVYHGTSFESASHIINSGFRGVGSRSKYGKGIYTSSSVWTSLLYANPSLTNEFEQTFLVANLLVGPSAVGKQGLVDFGCNEHGQRILTLTDSRKQIFCAAYDNQLAVTYQITVKYDFTNQRTDAKAFIYLHPLILQKRVFENTKSSITSIRNTTSDTKKILQILDIDEKLLNAWFINGLTMGDTTTKLRRRIKLYMDEKKTIKASTAPQQQQPSTSYTTALGKRKFSNSSDKMQALFDHLLQAIADDEVDHILSCLKTLASTMQDRDCDRLIDANVDTMHIIMELLGKTEVEKLIYALIELLYFWLKKHFSLYSNMDKRRGILVMVLLRENVVSNLLKVMQKSLFISKAYFTMACDFIRSCVQEGSFHRGDSKLCLKIDEDMYNEFCVSCYTKFKGRKSTFIGMRTLCMILNMDTSPKLSSFKRESFLQDHVVPTVAENVRDHYFLRDFATLLGHNIITIVNKDGVSGVNPMREHGLLKYLFEFRAKKELCPEIQNFVTKYDHLYVSDRW